MDDASLARLWTPAPGVPGAFGRAGRVLAPVLRPVRPGATWRARGRRGGRFRAAFEALRGGVGKGLDSILTMLHKCVVFGLRVEVPKEGKRLQGGPRP